MSRPRLIAIDVRMLGASGIGTYIRNLLPRLIESRPQYRFALLGNPDELCARDWSHAENVQVIPCRAPIYSAAEQWELVARAPRRLDVFWAPHYNVPLFLPAPLMVTVHDVFHLAMPAFVPGFHRRLYARVMFAAVRHKASAIVTNSHFTTREFLRLLGTSGPAPHPIHLGVDESWFRVTATRRPLEEPYLLYVGNVKPHKNLVTLLRAFASIRRTIPHHLVIVGKREGFITGDTAAAELAATIGPRVHFTEEIEMSLLEQYMAFAQALVLPSLYEGFGLPPLEAMACGCPVIVSRAASLPEVCGDAALYCDPHSSQDVAAQMLRLLGDEELREELRRHGRQRAASFTWSRCAGETLQVMDRLLAS